MGETYKPAKHKSQTKQATSTLVSKNVTVDGHRTSIRLEPEMWLALKEIAYRERCTIHDLCTLVSLSKEEESSLTASIRVFLMLYYRAATTEVGHRNAGHGNFDAMLERARRNASNGVEHEAIEEEQEVIVQKKQPELIYRDYIPASKKIECEGVRETQNPFRFTGVISERTADGSARS